LSLCGRISSWHCAKEILDEQLPRSGLVQFSFLHTASHFSDLPTLREQPTDDRLRKTENSRPDTGPAMQPAKTQGAPAIRRENLAAYCETLPQALLVFL
jgi:hypothetical protein